jgi:glutamate-5-semialdehyde dehydrogenase
MINLQKIGHSARDASYQLALLNTHSKNQLLLTIAEMLEAQSAAILAANRQDITRAQAAGMSAALLDRLLLNEQRLQAIAADVRQLVSLSDPVGQIIDGGQLDNGLRIERRRVPLGVVAVIYEARPNVTVDVATLCLKTGNAVILRGGKETVETNAVLVSLIQQALATHQLPINAVQVISDPAREWVNGLLKLDRYVDMLIPRGGAALHQLCREQSTIPVITGGNGVCHLYLAEDYPSELAIPLIINAKKHRPSACNSLETLLVHRSRILDFLPDFCQSLAKAEIHLHADANIIQLLPKQTGCLISELAKENYTQEWLSLDLNIKLVDSLEQAVDHIREYSTQHSDAILTHSLSTANAFVQAVDSAAVYVNASTRFTDGGEFGLGAEVAVSTQKLHARGPMGLEALTTYKWIAWGQNAVRQ